MIGVGVGVGGGVSAAVGAAVAVGGTVTWATGAAVDGAGGPDVMSTIDMDGAAPGGESAWPIAPSMSTRPAPPAASLGKETEARAGVGVPGVTHPEPPGALAALSFELWAAVGAAFVSAGGVRWRLRPVLGAVGLGCFAALVRSTGVANAAELGALSKSKPQPWQYWK